MKQQFLDLKGLTELVGYLKDSIANKKVILPYASSTLFPSVGDINSVYIDTSTNSIYRWDSANKKYEILAKAVKSVSISESTENGKITLTVDGTKTTVPIHGLKSAAYTEASAYATAAQGAKAESAVQSVSLASGTNNGTVKITVNGKTTDNIAVKGLGSAAYTASSAYATAGHTHTKAQIGLGNVDNTADKDKSVKHATTANSATTATNATNATNVSGENATGDTARHVWFSRSDSETKRVYNDNFKYNPATNLLTTNITGSAASASSVPWTGVTGKPSTFTPSAHNHDDSTITSLNASKLFGTIDIARLPHGALERCVIVADDDARFKLTTADVQLGDTVKVDKTKIMYFVINESKLNSEEGYTIYTAGTATSVPWSGVTGKPSSYPPASHNHDERYYTETEMNSKLAEKAEKVHTHVKSEVGLGNVDNTADANKSVKYATFAGSSTTSGAISSSGTLDTVAKLDAFIEGGKVKYALMSALDGLNGMIKNDGICISTPWSSTGYGHQFYINDNGFDIYHRFRNTSKVNNVDTVTWSSWKQMLDSSNYSLYTVTKTGTGASGTWGISVSGNAATATKFATARSINGTNFDGSGNITTATWGTARNITIGNTKKSVNGGADVSWSLSEIGAAASSHTHSYLPLSGGTMSGTAFITWPDSGNWSKNNANVTFPVTRGGLSWSGQSDGIQLYAVETGNDNLELYLRFSDDNSNGLSIRNKDNAQTARISATGIITASSFVGNLNGTASAAPWSGITGKPTSYPPSSHTHAYLPLAGGTMTGALNFANNTWNVVGDDVAIGDMNIGGKLGIMGKNGNTGIKLVQNGASTTSGSSAPGVTWVCTGDGASTMSGTLSGTFKGDLTGNASTATALTTSSGSATQPVYFASGKPAATTYQLNATVNKGTSSRIAYYSNDTTVSPISNFKYFTQANTKKATQTVLRLWGQTYGNDGSTKISGSAGSLDWNDGGPQIQFGSSESTAQDGALIYTDHDSAGIGASFHFVTNQTETSVVSKNFVARSRVIINQNAHTSSNQGYNLYVNGTALVNGVLTANGDCNFIAHGNEFNFVPTLKAASSVWFNYRQTGGQPTDASFIIDKYVFGNGANKQLAYISDGYFSGNASSATKLATARNIFGKSFNGAADIAGQGIFYGTYTATASSRYANSGLQIRENDLVGANQTDIGYAPSIGFHWAKKIAATLLFHNDGIFYFRKQDGTSRATIDANVNGNASTATALTSSAGSATQPVYFSGGKPVACSYTLGKSVPADAKFTDTNTWRGVQNNLTSTATDQSLAAAQGKVLNEKKMGAVSANGYYGMAKPDGTTSDWIRTTSAGIIPYQSGNRGSGHSGLGTSSWYFANSYVDNAYVNKTTVADKVRLEYDSTNTCLNFVFL